MTPQKNAMIKLLVMEMDVPLNARSKIRTNAIKLEQKAFAINVVTEKSKGLKPAMMAF